MVWREVFKTELLHCSYNNIDEVHVGDAHVSNAFLTAP